MNGHRLVARLREHQAAILANTNRARQALAEGVPDDALLARLRWEMVRLMSAYQYFKHREVFDVLIADGNNNEARIARRLKAECISLGEEVRRFVADRSGTQSASAQAQRGQILAFIDRIWEHMDYERRAVIAILDPADGEAAHVIPPPAVEAAQRVG
ncbi:hypothetical protein D9601_00320 [Sphingomonas sp. MA1305]|uniref:hypothetical protein n=1 Tax=Sphingomonas sp. MA1305 TaxID=2479204 RepID=UPI0018DF4588|nr:hypothetical protein [Sphingomonas sp. MA1305]MBI0473807.1 hypothetical protein [Sphingomonas sp. MA1305]